MSNTKNILLLGQAKSGKTSLVALISNLLSPIGYAEGRSYFDLDNEDSVIPGTTIQGTSLEYIRLAPDKKTSVTRNLIDCKKQADLPALLNTFKFDAAIWVVGAAGVGWDDMQQIGLARLFKVPYVTICISTDTASSPDEIEGNQLEASNLIHNEIGLPLQIKMHKARLEECTQQLALEEEDEMTEDDVTVKDEASKDILTAEQIQVLLEQLPSDEVCEKIEADFSHLPYEYQITAMPINIETFRSLPNYQDILEHLLDHCLEGHFNKLP